MSTRAFDLAELLGVIAVLLGILAIAPQLLEWYFERRGPLWAWADCPRPVVNPVSEVLVRLRVKNRIRALVPTQISISFSTGYSELFEAPQMRIFPSNENGSYFGLPGHDARDVEIRLKPRPKASGTVRVQLSLVAVRFKMQVVHLQPIELTVDQNVSA